MGDGMTSAKSIADDPIFKALEEAAKWLPSQGPIGVFVHHNPLHAFEQQPFFSALETAEEVLGYQVFWPLERYRTELQAGRITPTSLAEAHSEEWAGQDSSLPLALTTRQLRMSLLLRELDPVDTASAIYELQGDPVFEAALQRVTHMPARLTRTDKPKRHRDVLLALTGEDTDLLLHKELQRLCAAFFDQGQSLVRMPLRERGFLYAVAASYLSQASPPPAAPEVATEFAHYAGLFVTEAVGDIALRACREQLAVLGVPVEQQFAMALDCALALPGWAGLFARLERTPEALVNEPVPARLLDYLAVRLLYERCLVQRACSRHGLPLSWPKLESLLPRQQPRAHQQDGVLLANIAAVAKATPRQVSELSDSDLGALFAAVSDFSRHQRQRVFHRAFERDYRDTVLNAIAARRQKRINVPDSAEADFVFCIDEREESIRRALEEQGQSWRTFGAAGFFGLAIDYKGLDDEQPAPYCPAIVAPDHEVHEVALDRGAVQIRHARRNQWRDWNRQIVAASRTLFGGALQSLLLGPFAGLSALSKILAPERAHQAWDLFARTALPRPPTKLLSRRVTNASRVEKAASGKWLGFSLEESADRVATTLKNIGLPANHAPIVIILGHGSTSLNNPHESAHDCGACGGRQGGPNARLLAEMANHDDVRAELRSRSVHIAEGTWFVGALHDTANDAVLYYDLDTIPVSLRPAFDRAHLALEQARRDNAKERTRRFLDASLSLSPSEALAHVEKRSRSLAQPRPEYGHCTNAVCIVGRRQLSAGIHLDRRAFLVSYDPTLDADGSVLQRLLSAVGPVCSGISLEYYFSAVENERFGCGTKLPHNLTGLIGVMNGHQSDLRTGLPLQMVELHEPMRLLVIVEADEAALRRVAERTPVWKSLTDNGWLQLASVDPTTGKMAVYDGQSFVEYQTRSEALPVVLRSVDYHQHSRGHLAPALIEVRGV